MIERDSAPSGSGQMINTVCPLDRSFAASTRLGVSSNLSLDLARTPLHVALDLIANTKMFVLQNYMFFYDHAFIVFSSRSRVINETVKTQTERKRIFPYEKCSNFFSQTRFACLSVFGGDPPHPPCCLKIIILIKDILNFLSIAF